jgi:hypothetical protein
MVFTKRKRFFVVLTVLPLFLISIVGAIFLINHQNHSDEGLFDIDALLKSDDSSPPASVPISQKDLQALPADPTGLGGYNVLIADRGNNRVIEVTPNKQIVWEYDFKNLHAGYAADDAFFVDGGKSIIVNLEYYQVIETIDYATKKITWQYGTPGKHGSGPNLLFSPDDAYKLANGDVMVADIKNCRILEISPDKKIVKQYGKVRQCADKPGYLAAPNADTPLPDGGVLISNILSKDVVQLDSQWNPIFTLAVPLKYPSDPHFTKAGNILIADYSNPGKVIEITRAGNVVWEYDGENGVLLNQPSLAIELPNGNILVNDDYNHRVIVIDKLTKKIVWQYGVTGKPGVGVGQLNIPDGVDIIMRPSTLVVSHDTPSLATSTPVYGVGQVTRHAFLYINQTVTMKGYLLKGEKGYLIFSDEATGAISQYDLPVSGAGIDVIKPGVPYQIQGVFLDHGLTASNGNPDHLELSKAPSPL